MGYYLNVLQEGQIYELDGQRLQFIEKVGEWFYFYVCKMDEWTFNYEPTNEKVFYSSKELAYIKRVRDFQTGAGLRKIGKDKVFPRN
jgi:hypothetical protein